MLRRLEGSDGFDDFGALLDIQIYWTTCRLELHLEPYKALLLGSVPSISQAIGLVMLLRHVNDSHHHTAHSHVSFRISVSNCTCRDDTGEPNCDHLNA